MENKAEYVQGLTEVFSDLTNFLEDLDEAQVTAPSRAANWSVVDIVAHLTAWQKVTAERLQAGLENRSPDFSVWPAEFDFETEHDVDTINDWIYRQYQGKLWEDVYREWKGRFQKVIELTEKVPEADLLAVGKWSWMVGYALVAVLEGTYGHHREHLEGLKEAFSEE